MRYEEIGEFYSFCEALGYDEHSFYSVRMFKEFKAQGHTL